MASVTGFKIGAKNVLEKRYQLAQTYLIFATFLVPSIHPMLSYNLSINISKFKVTETQTTILLPFFIFLITILGYYAFLSKKTDLTMRDLWFVNIIAIIASFLLSIIIALPTSLVGAAYYESVNQQLLFILLIIIITSIIGWSLIITPKELEKEIQ
jgi:hypothetical protein